MIVRAGGCFMGLSIPPSGSGVDYLAGGKFTGSHRYEFALLNLAQHHGLGNVFTGLVELNPAVEGLQIHRSDGLAHFLGVEGIGPL